MCKQPLVDDQDLKFLSKSYDSFHNCRYGHARYVPICLVIHLVDAMAATLLGGPIALSSLESHSTSLVMYALVTNIRGRSWYLL